MSTPSHLSPSPFHHLVEYGYAAAEPEGSDDASLQAFSSTMNRVFARLIEQPGEPLWLGIVETLEPGSSAWMDAFGTSVVCLAEAANWWPGTERLSLGETRVRAVPVEAFGRDWKRIEALVGEGLYPAFDPFLFSRHPEGDLCRVETVGHEGTAFCRLPEGDSATGSWLESLGFSRGDLVPVSAEPSPLCGVRSREELVEIFGEESVAFLESKSRNKPA